MHNDHITMPRTPWACMWKIVATLTKVDGEWTCTRQLPTFYVQAVSRRNAEEIAIDLVIGHVGGNVTLSLDAVEA